MKRVLSLFCLCVVLIVTSSTQGRNPLVKAMDNAIQGQADLLIQTDGKTQPVINQITKDGGTINYQYQNVPVIAATVPTKTLRAVYQHPNVVSVSKDHLLSLLDGSSANSHSRETDVYTLDGSRFTVNTFDAGTLDANNIPFGYGGFLFTGADEIWKQGQLGSSSVVAVVDTGTVPNDCLGNAVIGAPGYPDGYNATGDGIAATDPRNLWHGTHIGGVIASACGLDFSDSPSDPINQASATYLPWTNNIIPIFGQAPAAKIYPVKVFDTTGAGSPTSVILDALDHLLTLKSTGVLDIDIVNLSFGGPTGYDGRAILDEFLEQFREQGMLVIAAAGNSGPLPNSLASPATSYDSIAVGALDYAPTSRAFYEYLGLKELGAAGQGLIMRPTDELRVADFSSRGPMSDGRFGPDLVAPGMWSFQFGSQGNLHWDVGTSYAAAAVSGAAALLNGYYEAENGSATDTPWLLLRDSLLLGADRSVIGKDWQDINTAGYGALDAAAALEILKSGHAHLDSPGRSEHLRANILPNPRSGDAQEFDSGDVSLFPSQSFDTVFEISPSTSKVTIHVTEISTPDNSESAYWPNSLKILVQSAKRSAFSAPIDTYWDPHLSGSEFTIEINDGTWSLADKPWTYQPMEPGLMKVSLIADYANESPISFKLRVTRQEDRAMDKLKPIEQSIVNMGDVISIPVELPTGTGKATFDLVWNRDWQKFPTSDLDLLLYQPDGNLASSDGATWNAPERVVIADPVPGIWKIQIEAREVYKTDLFRLYLQTEPDPQFDIISQHPASESNPGTGDDTTSSHIIWLPIIP